MTWFRKHLKFANVISCIALFVALGGVSYAALKLPKNSVGGKQIKKNAVSSTKVKNGSLKKGDFKAGQLPAGARGPQGLQGVPGTPGAPGANGTADAYARVGFDGANPAVRPLEPDDAGQAPQVKGLVQADVVPGEAGAATGTTCFNLPTRPGSAVATLDNADAAVADRNLVVSVAIDRGEDLGDCPGTHNDARVRIVDGNTEAAQNARFFIWFEL
jgi:hypothetical protein